MNPWGLGVICARVRGAGGIFQGGQQALWGCVAQHTWREEQVKQELWKLILCRHKVFLAVLTWTVSQNGVCMFSFAGSFVGGSSSPFPPSPSSLPTPVSFLSPESGSEVTFSFMTNLFGTWPFLFEKVLIWRKEPRRRSFAPFRPEKSAWKVLRQNIKFPVTWGENASSMPSSCKAGPSSRSEWMSKTGTARSSDCETKDLENNCHFPRHRRHPPQKSIPSVAVNPLLQLFEASCQELVGPPG